MESSNAEAAGFTGTSTGDTPAGRRGDRPFMPLSKRVDMALRTYKHSIFRAVVRADFSEPWCTSVPMHTGGTNDRPVAVDGELRIPQCFGGRDEPWAQLGTADINDLVSVLTRTADTYVAPTVLDLAVAGI